MSQGNLFWIEIEKHIRIVRLNIEALIRLTHLFLPEMKKRGSGKILNVASTAAFQPGPLMSIYFASKDFVLSQTEATANEIKDSGVTISVLCPGPTKTDFAIKAGEDKTKLMTNKKWIMNPDKVAHIGYKGLMKGKLIIIPGKLNKFLVMLTRFVPRWVATTISRSLQEERKT